MTWGGAPGFGQGDSDTSSDKDNLQPEIPAISLSKNQGFSPRVQNCPALYHR
eukprot:CAMPEP_0113969422 /NCGR_PEP_ID=MMETSP0011_2-20120614/10311_1 /TAXON_ID=101924 /ORGANISM="Rhodosorus marinus" /LENGTH=51 /DNA_ID=CAMNT_0000983083 /DNA_START=71 /DNA_END=222 /DNA_ORIENTATION=+ /assembly_acc=CAM_ASM_000156